MTDYERGVEMAGSAYREVVREYEAENERLRKLVRYMYRCFVEGHDWGPWCRDETEYVRECMRELGMEVWDA